ncbi:hypothetical protein ALC56_10747 [Trachymyrmex septentrionalis]|uniref:Uncharacterized protein n=1 Tax=Trachymyrmex septentrionalis TaxID=34720 RepID=A0A195F3W8_9HYME|nr:hypothetical protein ALC56_10747 [Trachymyrmex septentrionalis]
MTLSLAPDRTCRLKFPVVAEELIEYSGARHEERSRRTSAGKLWVSEGKLSPPPSLSSFGKAGARPRGRNPFADCHGQALAIIPADFECNDEVSFMDPQGNLVAHRSAKVSRVLSSSNRLDVRGRPRGKGCTTAERAVLSATPGN